MDTESSVGKKLRELSKEHTKRERWIKTRMWFSTFMSYAFPDMGYIPDNIGNNIFIGNNQYVTKNSISTVFLIREFSEETPVAFMSKFLREVKTKVDGVVVDFTIKNHKYSVDMSNKGLDNRVSQWMKTLSNPNASDRTKSRAARLLYTYDVAKAREKMFRSHVYVTVRAENGAKLRSATNAAKMFMDECQTYYKVIKTDLKGHLEYMAAMSDKGAGKIKDVPYTVQSALTLSELLPTIQGMNDLKGTFMGLARQNRAPYFIDYRGSSAGKNIYVVAPSGDGKTFMVINWILDGYSTGYNICLMDLKGNDYSAFTEAANGVTLSMRSDSTRYVNTFRMNSQEHEGDPVVYYNERFKLSKMLLLIIADLGERLESKGDALIEAFLKSFYSGLGVLSDNPNTWKRTDNVNPYTVFDRFKEYLSPEMRNAYSEVADKMLSRFKIYMDREGSSSHMFRQEYQIEEILDTKVLRFDFGMLESGKVKDLVTFKLRVLFMRLLNDEFIRHKKALGQWTMKVLEESQIAEDFLMQIYVEEMTLRRAQNQVTILLGNSSSALQANPIARPLLDNLNILVIGSVPKTSRKFLVDEYGLEAHEDKLLNIYNDPQYANTFLLVNRMQKDSTAALLKVFVPPHVANGKIFKNVDTVEELM
jgi:hypothetical protein